MNALLNTYKEKLSILAFPCNQFGHQEWGKDATEILNTLKHVRPGSGYIPHRNLTMMLKCDVNGPSEIPLYAYLKSACPIMPKTARFKPSENFFGDYIQPNDVTWNYEKFMVAPDGVPIFRFSPKVSPEELNDLIVALMSPVEYEEDMEAQKAQVEILLSQIDAKVDARLGNR